MNLDSTALFSVCLSAVIISRAERTRNYQRAYEARHREKVREYRRNYQRRNVEKRREYARTFARRHPEKLREYKRAYYASHKEQFRAASKRYRLTHKDSRPRRPHGRYKKRCAVCVDCGQELPKGQFSDPNRMWPIPYLRPKYWRCAECEAELVRAPVELARHADVRQRQLEARGWFYYAPAPDQEIDDEAEVGDERGILNRLALLAYAGLPERCRNVVGARERGDTLQSVGEVMGFTRQRADQIYASAMTAVRRRILHAYLVYRQSGWDAAVRSLDMKFHVAGVVSPDFVAEIKRQVLQVYRKAL